MVDVPTPADLAVQMLESRDVPTATSVLGGWLLELTGATLAVRARLGAVPGDWPVLASARTELPPVEDWPGPDRLREHPLNRFHRATGSLRPTLLREAEAAGWTLDAQDHEELERLRLTRHQVTVPTLRDPRALLGGNWQGWVLVSEDPLRPRVVDRLAAALPTIVGADHHLGLLTQAFPSTGPTPVPPDPAVPTGTVGPAPLLTAREQLILTMLAQGRTAAAVATRLAISPRTVHKHQEHLYRKLGAVDRLSAVLAGQRLGLLPAPTLQDPVPAAVPRPQCRARSAP